MVMNRRLKKQFWELRRHRNVLNYVRFPIGFYKASFHQLCVKWQSWDGFQKHTGVPWPHCGTGRCSTAVLGGTRSHRQHRTGPYPYRKIAPWFCISEAKCLPNWWQNILIAYGQDFHFCRVHRQHFLKHPLEARNQNMKNRRHYSEDRGRNFTQTSLQSSQSSIFLPNKSLTTTAQITELNRSLSKLTQHGCAAPGWAALTSLQKHTEKKPNIHPSQQVTCTQPVLNQVQINYSPVLCCPCNINTVRYHWLCATLEIPH